ncbi:PilN domain-containing protein [Neobacillus drentensis]|uniref:PilN domain-containing protein n=2 Tax=Neobacillus drentensis TaxID=220684 RepID=UPI002FFF6FC3
MMLVDINLLPQKEPKKISFLITLSCLLALIILIGGFYFWKTQILKDELTSLDKQITMTKQIAEKQDKKSETVASADSVSQLKSAIDWVNEYPIQTIPVMRHLTALLPERGFIQSFGYTESGSVAISVQFDSAREAAFFLDSLNRSKWIEEASLSSLATTTSETETTATNTVASNSQANTPSTTTDATTQSTTDTTSTEIIQDNSSSDTTALQNSPNNSTTTTNQNSENDFPTGDLTGTTSMSTSNILPRYTGQFEIKFDKEAIKKILKKSKQDEEGVKDS